MSTINVVYISVVCLTFSHVLEEHSGVYIYMDARALAAGVPPSSYYGHIQVPAVDYSCSGFTISGDDKAFLADFCIITNPGSPCAIFNPWTLSVTF